MRKTQFSILFSTLLVLLVSCNDYESLDGEIPTNSNLKSYYIKGSKAKKAATKFASHFKKPLQSSGTEFRTTEGIVIDYESILVVENELEHTSYTFKVDSPEESETVFQNIAMVEKPNQTVTKLITYEMSPEFAEKYTADLAPISKFEGTITIQTIAGEDCCSESEIVTVGGSDGGDSANDGTGWGIGTSGGSTGGSSDSPQRCPSGMHVRGNLQCIYTTASSNLVFLSQRTASPSTTTNHNNGTPPELCCIYDIGLYQDAMHKQDCEKLKKLSEPNNQNINSKIDSLKQKVINNTPIEWGVEFRQTGYDDPDTPQDEVVYENSLKQGNDKTVELCTGATLIGGAHCHTKNGYGIYSFGDIDFLLEAYNRTSPRRKHLVSFMLVCHNPNDPLHPNVYSITVNDISKLQAARDAVWNNPRYTITPTGNQDEDYNAKMEKIHLDLKYEYDKNKGNLEKYFLQKFSNYGISLYKADNDLSNWNQLELDTDANNNLIVQPKPCN